ncbi:hypothetical protein FHS18_005970 [Paenibacillus phyllosphaerae]|uniref:Uncharacterized protein n=1 Tax=Paenibacillus phyllosphaerae TaxID=274593 RepID=A0A7W5B3P8_9BACL|nr:hypothetical protein [Paenibacillus phyllosphaerae]MBB3113855.1 hypothetical protein [Paenibacillus phyllosphaerae]
MRTEDQIKRKLNELNLQHKNLRSSLSPEEAQANPHLGRIEDMIALLEWVLNAPSGSYHS